MKNFTLLAAGLLLIYSSPLLAQTDWHLGGNTVSSSQRLGTNGNYSLIFETNSSDRGRITGGGNWGIGTDDPTAKLHVNSTVSGQIPFRVQVLGSTKFLLHNNGGVAIGVNATPPTNGLVVAGSAAIGTSTPSSNYRLKVLGNSNSIYGEGSNSDTGIGVYGRGPYIGVTGFGDEIGVEGYSDDQYGGSFVSFNGIGLRAITYNTDAFAATFEGDTYTFGTAYQSSDKNLKKNIQEMSNALSIINKLKPKHYEFRNDGKYASLQLPKGNHFGLLAQDVEEVLPELVRETAHQVVDITSTAALKPSADPKSKSLKPINDRKESITIKGVNYTEMIPLLIAAVQEQQQIIQQQQQEIKAFKERFAKLESGNNTGSTIKLTPADLMGISLEQNRPNPTGSTTTFRYTVPANVNAQILIYNSASGKLVKTLQAPASGQVELNAADLEAGTYIYTLVVEGKKAAAKQLMISK